LHPPPSRHEIVCEHILDSFARSDSSEELGLIPEDREDGRIVTDSAVVEQRRA